MSGWAWVGIALVLVVVALYWQLVWIPRHSLLASLDELPHIRAAVEQLGRLPHVDVVEEEWRFALTVASQQSPPELAFHNEFRIAGYWLTTSGPSEDDIVRWEVTANKRAFEWITEGFDGRGDKVVEHRFNPGSYRSNLFSHTAEELDSMAEGLSREVTQWVIVLGPDLHD